jgi:hypothetical protein
MINIKIKYPQTEGATVHTENDLNIILNTWKTD